MNVTVVPHGSLAYLTVWPTGQEQPLASTLNAQDGRVKANAVIVGGGDGGKVSVYAHDQTDLILDVTGYFTTSGPDLYVPVTPCRLVDTRTSSGAEPFGSPSLAAGQVRVFNLRGDALLDSIGLPYCFPQDVLANGGALSLNITAVPIDAAPVGYVTLWGTDANDLTTPLVSNLNDTTGTGVADAAIVTVNKADQSISVYASDNTDLVVDVTGYFIPASASNGFSLYTMQPCRVLDTRETGASLSGQMKFPISSGNSCAVPAANAYVVNATVVPDLYLDYLTLWPDGQTQPLASTLNAWDGQVTSNMAIISSTNGAIDAFTSQSSALVMDVSGYFARSTPPVTLLLGDQLMYSALTPDVLAANPTWVNAASNSWETSASMLARFETDVVNRVPRPTTVVIWAGEGDLITYPDWNGDLPSCGSYTDPASGQPESTCGNLFQMAKAAQAAGIACVLVNMSPSAYQPNPAVDPGMIFGVNEELYRDYYYLTPRGQYGSVLADFALYSNDDFTSNGMLLSVAGVQAVESRIQSELQLLNASASFRSSAVSSK